jgi:hypothetical protein
MITQNTDTDMCLADNISSHQCDDLAQVNHMLTEGAPENRDADIDKADDMIPH